VILRNLAIVVFLLALALYLELRHDTENYASRCDLVDSGAEDKSEAAIARLTLTGYRSVRSRRTTVVALREDTDPGRVLGNVCEQRWYIAKLIEALEASGASEVVVDKFFGPSSCAQDDAGTAALLSALQKSKVPVIVGRATHTPKSGDPRSSCLILSESLDFGDKIGVDGRLTEIPAVVAGLTRLNADVRKIPMNWSCYASDAEFSSGATPTDTRVGTLSWVAASSFDTGLKSEPRLLQLREEGFHPFTSFIDPASMSRASALSVLCRSSVKDEVASRYKINCAQYPPGDAQFGGRIAVIGEDVEGSDQHNLFGGNVSGVYLQANYIESLLDDRFLKPLDTFWDYFGLLLWLTFLYLIFWVQPEIALSISIVVALLIRFLLTQLLLYKGLYPQITVLDIGLAALILKYVDSRGHLSIHELKERFRSEHPAPHRKRR
jgi:hypothetical protein